MPSTRKRIRRRYIPPISKNFSDYLLYDVRADGDFDFFLFKINRERQKHLWQENQVRFMAEWVESHPCSRPFGWWKFEAPEPRKMIGGKGTRAGQKRNYGQSFKFGVPQYWLEIDGKSPPMFESQAAFLQRLGLLYDGEAKFLKENTQLLQTESIFKIVDPCFVLDVSGYK